MVEHERLLTGWRVVPVKLVPMTRDLMEKLEILERAREGSSDGYLIAANDVEAAYRAAKGAAK